MVDIAELERRKAVGGLINTLDDSDREVRKRGVYALSKIGKPAVEPLITALSDEDMYVRMAAALALGEIDDERAVEPLIST